MTSTGRDRSIQLTVEGEAAPEQGTSADTAADPSERLSRWGRVLAALVVVLATVAGVLAVTGGDDPQAWLSSPFIPTQPAPQAPVSAPGPASTITLADDLTSVDVELVAGISVVLSTQRLVGTRNEPPDATVVARSITSGQQLWRTDIDMADLVDPSGQEGIPTSGISPTVHLVAGPSVTTLASSDGPNLGEVALDANSGDVLWSSATTSEDQWGPAQRHPMAPFGARTEFVEGGARGEVVDLRTGEVVLEVGSWIQVTSTGWLSFRDERPVLHEFDGTEVGTVPTENRTFTQDNARSGMGDVAIAVDPANGTVTGRNLRSGAEWFQPLEAVEALADADPNNPVDVIVWELAPDRGLIATARHGNSPELLAVVEMHPDGPGQPLERTPATAQFVTTGGRTIGLCTDLMPSGVFGFGMTCPATLGLLGLDGSTIATLDEIPALPFVNHERSWVGLPTAQGWLLHEGTDLVLRSWDDLSERWRVPGLQSPQLIATGPEGIVAVTRGQAATLTWFPAG